MNLLRRIAPVLLGLWILIQGTSATADSFSALNANDARLYSQAFTAADRGELVSPDALAQLSDKSLVGVLELQRLMHPTAFRARYEDLTTWLGLYPDLAGVERVQALAERRRPDAAPVRSSASRAAREAYYGGAIERALTLAKAQDDHWIAGMAAWRQGLRSEARQHFEAVARDGREDIWVRAGGAFWASRAAYSLGELESGRSMLLMAAGWPGTFYGQIAERRMALVDLGPVAQSPSPILIRTSFSTNVPIPASTISMSLTAHRARALAQIGRYDQALAEARLGQSKARSAADRGAWKSLIADIRSLQGDAVAHQSDDLPTPDLSPEGGFTIPKAMVYALVKQESQFNPFAVSRAGAMGLMQIRPSSAAQAAGDDKLLTNPLPLLDPPTNLRIGQDYFTWLMERVVGFDLLKAVAAYNAGPSPVLKTVKALGQDSDSLLVIESLPAAETRHYVERVVASYWNYQKRFGGTSATLEALARGDSEADLRLDH